MAAMVVFSCAAYAANRGANLVFSNRPEMVSAVGSVVIGVCGNIWSRLGGGTAFTVMVTGVLFLVPVCTLHLLRSSPELTNDVTSRRSEMVVGSLAATTLPRKSTATVSTWVCA